MLFRVDTTAKQATKVSETSFAELKVLERYDLQRWILSTPELLGENLLVITTECDRFDRTSERLDVLALDEEGKLVIVELKRTAVATAADLQALRYAAYCSTWTLDDVVAERGRFLTKPGSAEPSMDGVRAEILEFAPRLETEGLDSKPRIILAAQEFPPEITATVLWLRSFLLDISCVRLVPYRTGDVTLVHSSVLIPLPEAKEFIVQRERKDARDSAVDAPARTADEFISALAPEVRPLVERLREWLLAQDDIGEKAATGWIAYRAQIDRAWLTWISTKRASVYVGLPPEAEPSDQLQTEVTKYGWYQARLSSERDVDEIQRLLSIDYGVRHRTLGMSASAR